MFLRTVIILMAWFIPMPLWLSIVATVCAGCGIIERIIRFIVKCIKAS